ncbi:DUF6233 domain-containing protein [Streptomyces canus]|uniref:DUF6233 domain-containing protein n=1 Tax=Streptomyces canus TaxID=58343 RepID=UPI0022575610|nr:hypothetical protein [Streptomyces canus]MCX4853946.1 hypothetical protein [Streptomyces canus]
MSLNTGESGSTGGYTLVDRLGSGSMGVVHLGHNPRTPRTSWTAPWRRRSTACGYARDHVRPVDGVDCDQVVTEKLEKTPQSALRGVVEESRPSRWVLAKLHEGRGPARPGLHAPDCEEAPHGAPLLDVDRALDAADRPGNRSARRPG